MTRIQDQHSRAFEELSALILRIIRPPPVPTPLSTPPEAMEPPSRQSSTSHLSAAAIASLLLGISLSLILSGSVTFLVGCMLMPWVLGLIVVTYLVGIVSNLSLLGRSILCPLATSSLFGKKNPDALLRYAITFSKWEGHRRSFLGPFDLEGSELDEESFEEGSLENAWQWDSSAHAWCGVCKAISSSSTSR